MGLMRLCRSLGGFFSSSYSRRRPDQTAGSASPPPPPPVKEVFISSSSSGRTDKSAETQNGEKFHCILGEREEEDYSAVAPQEASRNIKHKKNKPSSIIRKFLRRSENGKSPGADFSSATGGARDHKSRVSRRLDIIDKEDKILTSPRNNSHAARGVAASTCKACNGRSRVTLAMLMALEDLFREETPYRGEEKEFGVGVCVPGPVNRPSGSPLFAQHSDSLFPTSPCPLSSSSPCPPSLYIERSCSRSDGAENTSNVPLEMDGTTSGREESEVSVGCPFSSPDSSMVEQPSSSSLSGDPRSDDSSSRTPSSATLMSLSLRLLEHSLSLSSLSLSLSFGPLDAEAVAIEVAKASDRAEEAAKATRQAASEAMAVEALVEAC